MSCSHAAGTQRQRVCADAARYVKQEMAHSPKRAVVACEGACLKGEVARVAANILAYRLDREHFVRICLGDATTADSGMADLIGRAPEVIAIEGCPLQCATEILRTRFPDLQTSVVQASELYTFDRNKCFEVFDLPRSEIDGYAEAVAAYVADMVPEESDPKE